MMIIMCEKQVARTVSIEITIIAYNKQKSFMIDVGGCATLERWWTGRPGVLQSTGSQRVGHDWVTKLNWWFMSWIFIKYLKVLTTICATSYRKTAFEWNYWAFHLTRGLTSFQPARHKASLTAPPSSHWSHHIQTHNWVQPFSQKRLGLIISETSGGEFCTLTSNCSPLLGFTWVDSSPPFII